MASGTRPQDLNCDLNCNNFPSDSTSTSGGGGGGGDFVCKGKDAAPAEIRPADDGAATASQVISAALPSSSSTSSSFSAMPTMDFNEQFNLMKRKGETGPPDLSYEMNIAKSILQKYSSLSGDSLYDHLCDIIKRVIDERPPNVIDFFEEFSRNVREQKFHLPERFPPAAVYEETRMYHVSKKQLMSMRLKYANFDEEIAQGEHLPDNDTQAEEMNIEIASIPKKQHMMFVVFSERIQQLQLYWNQCGFDICKQDIFLLACSMDRLQTHPSILQCRFWGFINGLKDSYFIVEASLTRDQIQKRLDQMEEELRENLQKQLKRERCQPKIPPHIGPELTPGFYGWEDTQPEELARMTPLADPIPLPRHEEIYDVPPEMIGFGLNRYSYFVVNKLSDEWVELPIVTPKQIVISRQIKKFLTGDLDADVCSYPCFPGKEKHYLRTIVARITCGTTIAPRGYYRKMTKRERRLYEGADEFDEFEEEEEEEEEERGEGEEEEEEGGPIDNDIYPLRNENYEPPVLEDITAAGNWVHVRPYILNQGRIVWFDEEKARKEREKELERLRKLELLEEEEGEIEEVEEEQEEEEGGEEFDEAEDRQEYGPRIFSSCSKDSSIEFTVPWISRFTSQYTNKPERVLVMRSNVWPGSFTFTFDKVCETIYMGWGHKYSARNMPFHHLPPIVEEYPHHGDDFLETTDPSVADEEAYRNWLLSKQKRQQEYDNYAEEGWVGDDDDDVDEDEDENA